MFKFTSLFQRNKKDTVQQKNQQKKQSKQIGLKGFDADVTPRQGYAFYSDYFKIDGCYASILTFFHKHGANRSTGLAPMWGVLLLPRMHLGRGVSTHLMIGSNPMPKKWVTKKLDSMDELDKTQGNAAAQSGHTRSKLFSTYRSEDMQIVNSDVIDGDTYFKVDIKLLVKARTLKSLDNAVKILSRWYDQMLDGGFYIYPFNGQEYDDLQRIFQPASSQIGKNYGMTASELSGMYNLVSHGINDPYGDYMGTMVGDLNQAAVVWDIDNFRPGHHVICAADQSAASRVPNEHFPANTRGSTMWGVRLAQAALADNHRVIHLVLNDAKINRIGLDLSGITTYVAMNKGAINPFEMFGPRSEQLSILEQNTEKLRLMAHEIVPELNSVDLGKYFTKIVQYFYQDQDMLLHDAKDHPVDLRLVGLPHKEYPRLEDFCVYLLHAEHDAARHNNQRRVNSIEKLESAFGRMQSGGNAMLFDKYTTPKIDTTYKSRQIIYDFSGLMRRGRSVAMAQFINALDYAVASLRHGDLLIIDGTEEIEGSLGDRFSVKTYMANIIERLRKEGVRVAYLYDSVEKMLNDTDFNKFDDSDWILTGYMSHNMTLKYQKNMHHTLPQELANEVIHQDPLLYYLRRGMTNVLFEAAPTLSYHI